jgi:hypothetical protein
VAPGPFQAASGTETSIEGHMRSNHAQIPGARLERDTIGPVNGHKEMVIVKQE